MSSSRAAIVQSSKLSRFQQMRFAEPAISMDFRDPEGD